MWNRVQPLRPELAGTRRGDRIRPGLAACLTVGLLIAPPAYGEILVFTSGRTMSIAGHRVEGDSIVLRLRTGGEIVCPRALIARIEPDEVPRSEATLDGDGTAAPGPGDATAAVLRQGTAFDPLIEQAAARYGLHPELVRAVIRAESAFDPAARSPKGAMGLMQLMPATARRYGVHDPLDPRANVDAGVRHLRTLVDRFRNLPLALAAYNAGEEAVVRAGGIPPWAETRAYIARVLTFVALGAQPYGAATHSSR